MQITPDALPAEKPDRESPEGQANKTAFTMTPAEAKAYEEKTHKERMAQWEKTCQEMTVKELRQIVDEYQRSIEQMRVRLRDGEFDPHRDPEGYAKFERGIFRQEERRNIARRILEQKTKVPPETPASVINRLAGDANGQGLIKALNAAGFRDITDPRREDDGTGGYFPMTGTERGYLLAQAPGGREGVYIIVDPTAATVSISIDGGRTRFATYSSLEQMTKALPTLQIPPM